jgi:hypothetical protein
MASTAGVPAVTKVQEGPVDYLGTRYAPTPSTPFNVATFFPDLAFSAVQAVTSSPPTKTVNEYPKVYNRAVAGRGSRVYSVFSTVDANVVASLWFIRSDDNGKTWSTPLKLDGPATGTVTAYLSYSVAIDYANIDLVHIGYGMTFKPNTTDSYGHQVLATSSTGGQAFRQRDLVVIKNAAPQNNINLASRVANQIEILLDSAGWEPTPQAPAVVNTTAYYVDNNAGAGFPAMSAAAACPQQSCAPNQSSHFHALEGGRKVDHDGSTLRFAQPFRTAAQTGRNSRTCIVYANATKSGIYLQCSNNGVWSETDYAKIATPAGGANGNVSEPVAAYLQNGNIAVAWVDTNGNPVKDIKFTVINPQNYSVVRPASTVNNLVIGGDRRGDTPDLRVDDLGVLLTYRINTGEIIVDRSCDANTFAGGVVAVAANVAREQYPSLVTTDKPLLVTFQRGGPFGQWVHPLAP